jgi:type VI secretion system protein ImpF
MARPAATSVLRPSLLDRLVQPQGTRAFPSIGLRELKAAVARDLEWLLNTKTMLNDVSELAELPESRASILAYGIPDFSNASWRSEGDARRICRDIESAVKAFEPRLLPATVRVVILPNTSSTDMRLQFRIEGTLHVEPISEPVSFDSNVQTDTGAIEIEGGV